MRLRGRAPVTAREAAAGRPRRAPGGDRLAASSPASTGGGARRGRPAAGARRRHPARPSTSRAARAAAAAPGWVSVRTGPPENQPQEANIPSRQRWASDEHQQPRRPPPFKGQKGEAWEGGYRAPMVIRWPGVIKPGTVKNQLFAALDWVPTLVDIAGGPKGDGLKQQIEAGHIRASSRRRSTASTSATISKASRRSRPATSSSISPARRRPQCATRTGRCTTPCRSPGRPAGSCRSFRSTSPWSRTSSAIPSSRRSASTRSRP